MVFLEKLIKRIVNKRSNSTSILRSIVPLLEESGFINHAENNKMLYCSFNIASTCKLNRKNVILQIEY